DSHQSGPLQLNEMCLLDCPLRFQLNPNVAARSTVATPQVATPPGPTSDPGEFNIWTRLPGGVVGPVSASALASTLPGISARHVERSLASSNSIGANSMPRT